MKRLLAFATVIFFVNTVKAQHGSSVSIPDSTKKILIVETACGECQFHMTGKGCHLAVRFNGKSYFVNGTSIDDHGDAHAPDGFCEAIRKAEVQGKVIDNEFKVTYFKLIPAIVKEVPKKTSGR